MTISYFVFPSDVVRSAGVVRWWSKMFNGVKVFSATMLQDRERLGEKVTAWFAAHPQYRLVDIRVTQSSDSSFHCYAITVFYFDPELQ